MKPDWPAVLFFGFMFLLSAVASILVIAGVFR